VAEERHQVAALMLTSHSLLAFELARAGGAWSAAQPHLPHRAPELQGLSYREGPMAGRDWVRAINKERRDDLGDCPTLPEELLELIKTDATRVDGDWVRRFSSKRDSGPLATRATGG
jgi:hypothetical protein